MLLVSSWSSFRKGESHPKDGTLLFSCTVFSFLFFLATIWYSLISANPVVYAGAKVLIFQQITTGSYS